MEYSRRFRIEKKGSLALQPRNEPSHRAQNIAPNEVTGNATSPRQGLVFASFSLILDRLSLGHVRLQMLTKHLKKNLFMGFARVQFHQPYGDDVEIGAVDNDAWSYWFFHEANHSHCAPVLKALYT